MIQRLFLLAAALLWFLALYALRPEAAAAPACGADLDCACRYPDDAAPGVTDYAAGARAAVRAGRLTCPKGSR